MPDSSPRVSVIVPAYNAGEFIGEALESVHGQTFDDWEIVVCDDGSSDNTAAIAAGFGERVRVVRSPVNEGLASARNRAIADARGELLALLDADDTWLPDYLSHQLAVWEQSELRPGRTGVVSCNAYLRDADGRLPETYAERFGYADDVTVERLLDISPIFISALIPRAAIDEVGPFATDLRSCEDLDLWIRLVEAGYRVASTREPLVVYRLSPGQLSAQPVAMAQARQAVYRRAIERGRLTESQRRAARRAIRRERAIEVASVLSAQRRGGRAPVASALRSAPLLTRVLVENPSRWGRWARLATDALASRRRSADGERR